MGPPLPQGPQILLVGGNFGKNWQDGFDTNIVLSALVVSLLQPTSEELLRFCSLIASSCWAQGVATTSLWDLMRTSMESLGNQLPTSWQTSRRQETTLSMSMARPPTKSRFLKIQRVYQIYRSAPVLFATKLAARFGSGSWNLIGQPRYASIHLDTSSSSLGCALCSRWCDRL